jgi:hypothetical protein
MTLAVNSETCRSGKDAFRAACRIVRDFACGGGIVLTLALQGCTGRAETQVQYVRVEVPVRVPCRAPVVAVPSWAAAGLRKTDSLEVKVRALLAERRQRIGYEKEIIAALAACHY